MKRSVNKFIQACALYAAILLLFTGCMYTRAYEEAVPVAPPTATPEEAVQSVLESADAAVLIYHGNTLYDVAPLADKCITIDQGGGMRNEVTIHAGGVLMSHSTCSNQDCVRQGEITLENYTTRLLSNWIVCLPNQISIQLVVKQE